MKETLNKKEESLNFPRLMQGENSGIIYYITEYRTDSERFVKGLHLTGKNKGHYSDMIQLDLLISYKGTITLEND